MVLFDATQNMEAITSFRIHIEVRNPRTHISEERAQYTDFEVETQLICDGNIHNRFSVRRRYSEFKWLRGKLLEISPQRSPPQLPCRRLFWKFEKEFLQHRRIGLEKFLNGVLGVEEYVLSPSLLFFLRASCDITQLDEDEEQSLADVNIRDAYPLIDSDLEHPQYDGTIPKGNNTAEQSSSTNSPPGKGWAECFGEHSGDFLTHSLDSSHCKKGLAYVLPGGQLIIPGLSHSSSGSTQSLRRGSDGTRKLNSAPDRPCFQRSISNGANAPLCSGQSLGEAMRSFKTIVKSSSLDSLVPPASLGRIKYPRCRKWSSFDAVNSLEAKSQSCMKPAHCYYMHKDKTEQEGAHVIYKVDSSGDDEDQSTSHNPQDTPSSFNPRCLESSSEKELIETNAFSLIDSLTNTSLKKSIHLEEYDIIFPFVNFEDRKSEFYNSYLHAIANNYAVDYEEYDIVDSMVDGDSDSASCILNCSNECGCSLCPLRLFCSQLFGNSSESEHGMDEYDIISFREL